MKKIRNLRPDEAGAFDGLRDWLDGVQPEMTRAHRFRLRVFFQDHPVNELRVEEEVETC